MNALVKALKKMAVEMILNDETKVIKVKAGTQSGEMMRITGAGIPHVRGHGRGDQIIQMMVETPKKLNKKQKENT